MSLTLDDLEREVRALELPEGYLILGSAPMLAHGLLTQVNDVDIVARGAAWGRALELGRPEPGPGGDLVVRLGTVDIFDGWLGEDVADLLARREVVRGLPYASLPDVLAFKRKLNRPKDESHIQLLEAHLRD